MQLSVVLHEKESQEISFTKGGKESGWPFTGSSWQLYVKTIHAWNNYYTIIAVSSQVLELWSLVATLERILFLDFKLGLAVTEIKHQFSD